MASFSYNFYFLMTWETSFTDAYGWHFQFLTIIGLAASLVCFTLGALADIGRSRSLFQSKNAVSVLATLLEVVISILYWSIRTVELALLAQEGIQLPLLKDVGFHLAPAVLLTLDLVLLSPPWTVPACGTMAMSTVLAFAYWYWVELCFGKNKWYPYPLFELLGTAQRVFLFVFSAALVTASSGVLKWIYTSVNGYEKVCKELHKPLEKME